MGSPGPALLLTCEHGGHEVPRQYRALFRGRRSLLESHRGHDRGALPLARDLARRLRAPLVPATTTRLLVDLNRSAGHRALFSEITRSLEPAEKERILRDHYWPHRNAVARAIRRLRAGGRPVAHVAVHSFVPRLHGVAREVDVGLLYDPSRSFELEMCRRLRDSLRRRASHLRVRRNSPYRGVSDGLTTSLRKRHGEKAYAGIELEVNQSLLRRFSARLSRALAESLREAIATA